jgi:hypothetical protein
MKIFTRKKSKTSELFDFLKNRLHDNNSQINECLDQLKNIDLTLFDDERRDRIMRIQENIQKLLDFGLKIEKNFNEERVRYVCEKGSECDLLFGEQTCTAPHQIKKIIQ